ncbi:peptidoglycan-associated lipoprotein Pal [Stagnihabitans tardus]|uniref:Peptidoglycan-associated lipoprotein n=1 Tax=Stagnihabitans tardus TaxID=2699202 RepID=A0AAE5BUK2_9RHOB|nr:peptidoglycan-associated lipoprotein Pal [Stagnihabitans tardus]NBZ87292.1 peptidoglycan-associated lipoprotein Pal [Stagnihabitans tardus]
MRASVAFKVLMIVSALALSACRNPGGGDGFGADGAYGANGANGANGIGQDGIASGALGDPSNPASIAYFNQTVGDRVLFVVDQSTLTEEAKGILNGQAQWLAANPDYAIIVEGHADEQGTRDYNMSLGGRRADSVKNYLISKGVSGARIQTVTYGKERPIAICSDESCYSQNRRAVTVLSMGSGA